MQPQDPRDQRGQQNQAYPPQGGLSQGIPQPQIPGQPGQPPMPAYQQQPQPGFNPNNTPPNLGPLPEATATRYDFFMDPNAKRPIPGGKPLPVGGKLLGNRPVDPSNPGKTSLLSLGNLGGGGGPGGKKFIFLIAGAISIIVILLGIVAFAPKDNTNLAFFGIAQTQQEIIRVCTQGSLKGKTQTTRNFSITCVTTLTTSQQQLLAYMSKAKLDYDSKQLEGKKNSQTDTRLTQAQSSSTFDSVYREIIQAQLTAYNRSLTAQLGTTTSSTGREVLTKNQTTNEILTKMLVGDTATAN